MITSLLLISFLKFLINIHAGATRYYPGDGIYEIADFRLDNTYFPINDEATFKKRSQRSFRKTKKKNYNGMIITTRMSQFEKYLEKDSIQTMLGNMILDKL